MHRSLMRALVSTTFAAGRFAAVALGLLVALSGEAYAGALMASPAPVGFPNTAPLNTSAPITIRLTNTSAGTVTLDTVTITGTNSTDFRITTTPVPTSVVLLPGASQDVDVVFQPVTIGLRLATLRAQVLGETMPTDIPLNGTGVGPTAMVGPNPIRIGGLPWGQTIPPTPVSISNIGATGLVINSVSITGANAASFGLVNPPTANATLQSGESVMFQVSYMPTVQGSVQATLVVASNDPKNPSIQVPIIGASGDAKIGLDPATVIFGTQRVGTPAVNQDVIIRNDGFSTLTVNSLTFGGANAADFSFISMPLVPLAISPGATVQFTVGFQPTMVGARSATVQIASDDKSTPTKTLMLSGIGTTPMASVAPAMMDFGKVKVGVQASQMLSITNKGTGAFLVTDFNFTGASKMQLLSSLSAPIAVAPMSSVQVQINWKPTAVGAASGAISITTDDKSLPMIQVPITGEATAPMFVLDPISIDFGGVPVATQAAPQTFTISNTGNQVMNVTSMVLGGANPAQFALAPVPKTPFPVAAGSSQTFSVLYTPAMAQLDAAKVTITVDDPTHMSGVVLLQGSGTQGDISTVPRDGDDLDFGNVAVGTTAEKGITIQNTGNAPLTLTAFKLGGQSGGFSVDQTAPLTIMPLMTQVVHVTYAPRAAGKQTATFEIDSQDLPPVTITLVATATAPMLESKPTTIDFGPVFVGRTSAPIEVVIHNTSTTKAQTIDYVDTDDSKHFTIDDSMLEKTLKPGGNTSVFVSYKPEDESSNVGRIRVFVTGSTVVAATVLAKGEGIEMTDIPNRAGCAVGGRGRSSTPGILLLLVVAGLVVRRRERGSVAGA